MIPADSPCPQATDDHADTTLVPHLPAAAPHWCPLYQHEACTCCGSCANVCATIAKHVTDHSAMVTVNPDPVRGMTTMTVDYFLIYEDDDEDDPLANLWPDIETGE